jgi:hypothetical protein
MSEQQSERPSGGTSQQAPARKAESAFTPAQQLYVAKKIARKAVSLDAMANSIEAGGKGAGQGMADHATQSRTPADVAAEGFSGQAQEVPHRAEMESSFGTSFAGVKAYTDAPAAKASKELGAHAYAVGDQVAFGSANPDKATVAHELTHVLQHTGQGPAKKTAGGGDGGIDVSGEGEAEAVEAAVASGKPARSALEGAAGEHGAGAGHAHAGPARKTKGSPALHEAAPPNFMMGMTFSKEAFEKSYQYVLWQAKPPIEVPIVAVPGLNFLVEPMVSVKAAGGVNWKQKALQANVGVEGSVGLGFSYGKSEIAALYGIMEAKASGGFEYKKTDHEWELEGAIALSTNFKVGVRLAGGILDYGFEFGKCEIGKLTGLAWKNGHFEKGKLGWEWGEKPKEFFAAIKSAIDKAKRILAAGTEVAKRTWEGAKNTGKAVYNAGRDAVNWVTSW